jgi:hypothetical protein
VLVLHVNPVVVGKVALVILATVKATTVAGVDVTVAERAFLVVLLDLADAVFVLAQRVLIAGARGVKGTGLVIPLTLAGVSRGVSTAGVVFACHGFTLPQNVMVEKIYPPRGVTMEMALAGTD